MGSAKETGTTNKKAAAAKKATKRPARKTST
jgi:hypothetical protein